MKKRFFTIILFAAFFGLMIGCGKMADIGKDEAARIALEDAGYAETEVSRMRIAKDRDDGESIYEVEFTVGNTEYDYEISASDGTIISVDYDGSHAQSVQNQQDSDDQQAQSRQQEKAEQASSGQPDASGSNVQITAEAASQMALDRVPGASAADLKIELDYDDGRYKYEGDIIYNNKEYEFEIDAVTGDFLEWSEERR